ncbi:MAG: cytochrome [Nocardia sp.]|nr:cytochrome [Nocardia sp.]
MTAARARGALVGDRPASSTSAAGRSLIGRVHTRSSDSCRLRVASKRIVVLAHPEHARIVNVERVDKYTKGPSCDRARTLLIGDGLVTSVGKEWKTQRKMLSPFFTPKAVRGYAPLIMEDAQWFTQRWQDRVGSHVPVEMLSEMATLTASIILKSLFSTTAQDVREQLQDAVETMIQYTSGRQLKTERSPWATLGALCVGFFMILVDMTIVAVANPTIMNDLHTGLTTVVWVTSSYLLAYAVPLLVTGRLGDRRRLQHRASGGPGARQCRYRCADPGPAGRARHSIGGGGRKRAPARSGAARFQYGSGAVDVPAVGDPGDRNRLVPAAGGPAPGSGPSSAGPSSAGPNSAGRGKCGCDGNSLSRNTMGRLRETVTLDASRESR